MSGYDVEAIPLCPESRLLQGRWAGWSSTPPEWLLRDPAHWRIRTEAFRHRLQGQAGWGLSKEAGGPTACSGDFEAGLFSGGKECGCSHVSPFFRLLACGVGRGRHPSKTVGQSPITPGPAEVSVSVAIDTLQHVCISCGKTAAAVIYGFWMQPVSSPSSKDDAHLPYARCYLRTFATYLPPKKKHTQTRQTHKARGRDPCRRPPTRPVCTPFHRLRPFADRSSR